MEILRIEDLTFTYPDAPAPAVEEVSLSVSRGEFLLLMGGTGSGKSTFLRLLKEELAPRGTKSGMVHTHGTAVGFVMQDPEAQTVTDKVWHELAFGVENLGLPREEIARRVAEMAAYFGLEPLFDRDTATLSGGQKQLLALAAVMVMRPEILILDEPTAQLDPIAAADFLATLTRLHRDLGLTVIVAEHRTEELFPVADRVLLMEKGRLTAADEPRAAAAAIPQVHPLYPALPSAVRLWHAVGGGGDCPLTLREGRDFVTSRFPTGVLSAAEASTPRTAALTLRDVCFRYEKHGADVLSETSLTVYEGEIFCLLGGNGAGKSTLLKAAAGICRPFAGEITVFGRRMRDYKGSSLYENCVGLLPQYVQTVFLANTVEEELSDAYGDLSKAELPFDLSPLYGRHPYDLSGGEQQLLALSKVLATRPRLLLLDEPTKGLDAAVKESLLGIVKALAAAGMTVLTVTHDVEFAARLADRCALFFHGEVLAVGSPREFFSGNHFYTTAVSRMTRGHFDGAVTLADAVSLCREGDTVCG